MRPPSLIQSKAGEAAPFIFHLSYFYIQRAALLFPACLCRLPIASGRDIIRNIYKVNWEFVGLKQHLKPTWKQIALCVLFGLAAVLGVYVETLFLLLPAVFGFVWAAWGGICCAVSLGTAAAVLLVCFGSTQTLYALALFAPASLCVGCCLRFKKPYRTAAVSAAAAIAAGYYCLLCLPSLLAGEGPFAAMEETLLTLADAMASLGREFAQAGFDAAATEPMVELLRAASLLAPEITCIMIVSCGMAFGLMDVVLARRMALAAKAQLKPMAPFPLWQLSKNYTIGAAVLFVSALLVLLLKLNNANAVFVVAECVIFLPLMLMGVCFMDFLTRITGGNGKLRRALFYVCIVMLFPYSAIFLLILGLVDRISRLRRRFRPRDDQGQR